MSASRTTPGPRSTSSTSGRRRAPVRSWRRPMPEIIGVGFAPSYPDDSTPQAPPTTVDLPATVPGGGRATLTVELQAPTAPWIPPCPSSTCSSPTARRRDASSTARCRSSARQSLGLCLTPLPTGPQPADPTAAAGRCAPPRTSCTTRPRVDVAESTQSMTLVVSTEAEAEIRPGQYAEIAATTTATVGDISFDRPDHAWFHYELSQRRQASGPAKRSLVDGRGRSPAPPSAPTTPSPTSPARRSPADRSPRPSPNW